MTEIEETMLDEWLIEQINDRVNEGIYFDDDVASFDDENITIKLEEEEEFYPQKLEGRTPEKLACNDYDEHCKNCNKKGCKTVISLKWTATVKEIKTKSITYHVREK